MAIPVITLLTPNSSPAEDWIIITGTNFEAAQGAGGVTIDGIAATVKEWGNLEITVTVPAAAVSGNVVVTNNSGGVSAGTPWTLDAGAITIGMDAIDRATVDTGGYTYVDANHPANATGTLTKFRISIHTLAGDNSGAKVGVFFVVAGNNLTCRGSVPVTLSTGGITEHVISLAVQDGDYLGLWLPSGTTEVDRRFFGTSWWRTGDSMAVVNTAFATETSYLSFEAEGAVTPAIISLTPDNGPVGTSVTIAGTGFGAVQGDGAVRFNGALATITSWADNQIIAVVPSGATSGPVVVVNNAGAASNAQTMTVTSVPPYVSEGNTADVPDQNVDFYACTYAAQFFVLATSLQSPSVKIKGKKVGSPGIATFDIYAADATGKPTGPVLATGTDDPTTWTTDDSGVWVQVDCTPGVVLTAGGNGYVLVWRAAGGDGSNKGQAKGKGNGGYIPGNSLTSVDCGVSYTADAAADFLFEVTGSPVTAGGGVGHTPHVGGFSALSAGAIVCNPPVQG